MPIFYCGGRSNYNLILCMFKYFTELSFKQIYIYIIYISIYHKYLRELNSDCYAIYIY